jgi:Flp pilus assembly protein TadG
MFSKLRNDKRGVAAVEFALSVTVLIFCLLNAVDTGYYAYNLMEVENAAQVGAQAAWKTCSRSSMLPATVNCAGLTSAIMTAIQSTSLGSSVTLASNYPQEGYYCANSSSQLVSVGNLSNKPTDCSSVGSASTSPGDYIHVQVMFNFEPLFPGVTIVSKMGISTINKESWMRLG